MPRLTPEEAARIAMQYDAVVPEDIEVEKVPAGKGSAWGINMTRREAVDRARRVYQRMKRFQRAAVKAKKAQGS
jgi:hypothetical protein